MLAEFEGGQRRALIARAGLIDPNVNRNPGIMRVIDRRRRRAPVDTGEPPGVAMGQDVDGFVIFFRRDGFDDVEAMDADTAAHLDVVLGDGSGARVCRLNPFCRRQWL